MEPRSVVRSAAGSFVPEPLSDLTGQCQGLAALALGRESFASLSDGSGVQVGSVVSTGCTEQMATLVSLTGKFAGARRG